MYKHTHILCRGAAVFVICCSIDKLCEALSYRVKHRKNDASAKTNTLEMFYFKTGDDVSVNIKWG